MAETLKHMVMVKFNDEITSEQKQSLIDGFLVLPALIPHIKACEWGTDVSVENLHQGFTHVFILTFDSAEGHDAYLVHPAHEEYAAKFLPALDKIVVFDIKPSQIACS